jgi:hypothetical protein
VQDFFELVEMQGLKVGQSDMVPESIVKQRRVWAEAGPGEIWQTRVSRFQVWG